MVTLNFVCLKLINFVNNNPVAGIRTIEVVRFYAIAVQILEHISLKNLWQGKLEQFSFNTVGLEALATVKPAHVLYIPQTEAQLQQLQTNPIWLEFVQQQHVYSLGADTWLFGSPLFAQVLVDKVVIALT